MSFLEQVISNAGTAEMGDIKTKINTIRNQIMLIDAEVTEYLDEKYIKFIPLLTENRLELKAKKLYDEMNQLQSRIKSQDLYDLDDPGSGLKNITNHLEEINFSLTVVKHLLTVDDNFKKAEDDQNHKRYLEAARKFKLVQNLLNSNVDLKCLNVYKPLVLHMVSLQEKFLKETLEVWNTYIVWNEYDNQPNKEKHLTLKIDNSTNKSEIVQVLYYYDYLDFELKLLSTNILKRLFEPLIDYPSQIEIHEDDIVTLDISFSLKKISKKDRPSCLNVIYALKTVCSFLSNSLDIFINDSEIFINKLSELIEFKFCDYFINNCLSEAIPTNQVQYSQFSTIVDEVIQFDDLLKEKGILSQSNSTITNYIENADSLFAAKTCQQYLAEARKLCLQNLHDMVKVEPKHQPTTATLNDNPGDNLDDSEFELCKNTFLFPACYISKLVENVISLIRQVLDQMVTNTNLCAVELFYTARNIVSLYCDLVPLEHKNLLQSIPQQSALFHNNCMYLAHELILLGTEYSDVLKIDVTTFVDFIEPLRLLGQKTLNEQVDKQREQLIEILRESGLLSLHTDDFPLNVERSFRQCLRQLTLLQDVWKHVLPLATYCKTIGSLCNTFLEKLIGTVVSIEDIPMDTSSHLTNVFSIILEKIPSLFPEPKEVYRHIKRWQKFNELLKVLNGSLKDIDDRWADGKGPLAQEFSVEDVKHLIRALFQNTNQRASLLSRIR